jgi:hypothetical protein
MPTITTQCARLDGGADPPVLSALRLPSLHGVADRSREARLMASEAAVVRSYFSSGREVKAADGPKS